MARNPHVVDEFKQRLLHSGFDAGAKPVTDFTQYPILVVDDEEDNLDAFDLNFGDDYKILTATNGAEALEVLQEHPALVLVVDQRMPGMSGLEFLQKSQKIGGNRVAILLTAYRDVEVLASALNSGLVHRYIQKPWNIEETTAVLRQCLQWLHLQEENQRLTRRLEELNRYLSREVDRQFNYGDIVGSSARLKQTMATLKQVAPTQSTVLITGESGTGKELAATAIHYSSTRAKAPFVRVNLAAMNPNLIESELFGHEKGAFTGATQSRPGRLELAQGGSLFLDEIGDLPPETQVKLLRVLQEREYERVGGSRTLTMDVRIIAATNRDLQKLIEEGRFREDLYYRVNVFPIHMPPLRVRKEDIPELAEHFLGRFAPRVGKTFTGFTPGALEILGRYDWPGNVRELENVLERAMIVGVGERLTADDLAFLEPKGTAPPTDSEKALPEMLESFERQQLSQALEKNNGSVSRTARELGLNRTTLYYRLKKYGLIS